MKALLSLERVRDPFTDVFGTARGRRDRAPDAGEAVVLTNNGERFWPLLHGPGYQIGALSPATEWVAVGVMTHNGGHLWACAEVYSRPDNDEWRLRAAFETGEGALTAAIQRDEELEGQSDSLRGTGQELTHQALLAAWLDSDFAATVVPRPVDR